MTNEHEPAWVDELPDDHPLPPLPARVQVILLDAGIRTLGELRACSDQELLRLKGIGPWALRKILWSLAAPVTNGHGRSHDGE